MNTNYKKISKFLSFILRHHPERIGLELDAQGWASTDELLSKLRAEGKKINLQLLQAVVENNDKKRFAFNEDGTKIRASQGHSISIDLAYEPTAPPEYLYHGTATRFVNSIRKKGLIPNGRHHVHLSLNLETAKDVGARHGVPVVLTVNAKAMQEAGHTFFVSENNVWLTANVPVEFLDFS